MFAILEAQPAGSYVHTINYGNEIYALYAPDLILWNGNTDYTPAGYGFQWVDGTTNMISRIKATSRTGTTVLPNAYGVPEGGTPFNYIKFGSTYPSSDGAPAAAVARATPDGTKYCFGVNAAGATSGMLGWLVFLETNAVQYPDPLATYEAGGNVRYGGANDVPSGHSYGEILPNDFKIGLVYCKAYEGDVPKFMWVIYCESWNFCRTYMIQYHWQDIVFTLSEDGDPEGDEPEMDIPFPIPEPNYAVASGMVKVYRLQLGDCQALASDMWNDNWWSQVSHWFGENPPYEAVSSLGVVPYAPDNGATLSWGSYASIGLAGHTLPTAKGYPVTQTTYYTDFASQYVPTAYSGSFLDYEPFTTVQALLPFIGYVNLPAQFVVGHMLTFRYVIDVISGGVNVFIGNETTGVFAMHSGSCLYTIPTSSAEGGRLLDGIMSAATAGVSLATGVSITRPTTGKQHLSAEDVEALGKYKETQARQASVGRFANVVEVAQHAFDTTVSMRGSASGNMGFCASGNIYLYVHRPNVLDRSQYAPCVGFPTARYMPLSSCQGFTMVDSINLSGVPATKPEIERFEAMLHSGIVIPSAVVQPATSAGTSGMITLDLFTRTGCIHELNTSGSTTSRFTGITGAFRTGDTPTLSAPSVVVNNPFSDLSLVNYVHIAEFNRFYYVIDMIALTAETTLLVLSSDVLNSFWDSAKNTSAYIARQEDTSYVRNKLIDDKVVTGCMDGSTVDAYEISNPYAGAHQYIVVCAGAT